MPPEINKEEIREIIREELGELIKSDRFVFFKLLQIMDGRNIKLGTGTGTKFGTSTSEKLAFYNATPIVQPTTSHGAGAFVENSGTTVNINSRFDGYILQQIVQALRDVGILA